MHNKFLMFSVCFLLSLLVSCSHQSRVPLIEQNEISKYSYDLESGSANSEKNAVRGLAQIREFSIAANESLVVYYQKQLKKNFVKWTAFELEESLQLPGGKPVDRFYNTHLISAEIAGEKHYFRPIDTTTGCTSGCTPVVFHLVLNKAGKVQQILEEDRYPLRKINHQKFTQADKDKALAIAKSLPEALHYINEPKQLTDSLSAFPPQTWTKFKSMHVSGGVYTSYRIYEAAIKSAMALNPDDERIKEIEKEFSVVSKKAQAVSSVRALQAFVSEATGKLNGSVALHPAIKKAWIINTFALLEFLQNNKQANLDAYVHFFKIPDVKNYYQSQFCQLLVDSIKSSKTAGFAIAVYRNANVFPNCDKSLSEILAMIAFASLDQQSDLAKLRNEIDFNKRPVFILENPNYLEFYANQAMLAGFRESSIKYYAEVKARYPKFVPKTAFPNNSAEWRGKVLEARNEYIKALKRSFLQPPRALQTVKTHRGLNYEEKNKYEFPQKFETPYLAVFLASWCPHCKNKIAEWQKANFSEKFWKPIQFIEIFPRSGGTTLRGFCEETGMSKSAYSAKCTNALRFDSGAEHSKFLASLEIFGIPSLALFDKDGKLVSRTFELSDSPYADIERDLLDVISEIGSH
jgi:hypothetical protein